MLKSSDIVSQTVDTTRLSHGEQNALTDALYGIHQRIFDGVDRECFVQYVISPLADQNLLSVYRDSTGAVIGYCSLQRRDLDLSSGPVRILRGVLGFLPEHRGKSLGASFYAWNVVKHTMTARLSGRRCYMLGTPVGPLMYLAISRAMAEFWPHPEQRTPPATRRLMAELSEAYHLTPSDSGTPGCCRVGWIVRQTASERHALHGLSTPALRFFLNRNPGYQRGEGLILVVPFHASNLITGLIRALKTRQRRRRRAATKQPHTHRANR